MSITNYIFILAANFMAYCLFLVISSRKKFKGGIVGKYWNTLTILVVLFTLGYFGLPFIKELSEEALRLTVSVVFLFGAIYVLVTIILIKKIIESLENME